MEFILKPWDIPDFPKAADEDHIVKPDDEINLSNRAEAIASLWLEQDVANKKILDYGCGDGILGAELASRNAIVTGYDPYVHDERHGLTRVNSWRSINSRGKYDIIILFDVLDHIVDEEPEEILRFCKSQLNNDGRIYIRTHPWCGRTGGHIYQQLNLAWAHLIFTEKEFSDNGIIVPKVRKIIHPQYTYYKWINKSKFNIKKFDTTFTDVELFFEKNFSERIKEHWDRSQEDQELFLGTKFPSHPMSQQFHDIILA